MTIVNYASSIVNKLGALLTDNARVLIYDHHVFIVQATEHQWRRRIGFIILCNRCQINDEDQGFSCHCKPGFLGRLCEQVQIT
jgi:hypothetical protein